jgi:hypothetical protein
MIQHHPTHWIAVALVAALALLAFEVAGQGGAAQSTTAAGMFQGRPAMAGAQGGLGAQAGLPQGGLGVQGSQAAELNLRRPRIVDEPYDMPQGQPADVPAEVVLSGRTERLAAAQLDELTPREAREIARRVQ